MPELHAVTKQRERSSLALLAEIRDVMSTAEDVQVRLNQLVALIAGRMDSEVCSIYLLQPGRILELFATAGLKQSAIHSTRLAIGQGLVGEIAASAKPLNLADAQNHPKFVYREETGEESFQSFVGVPILSHHQAIGVLVVQSESAKIYSEEQLEVLQTVAMVLSELAVGQHLVDRFALAEDKTETSHSKALGGLKISPGLAKAEAVLHRPEIEITQLVSDDPDAEEKRLVEAIDALREHVDELIETSEMGSEGAHADILETYRMFTYDRGWLNKIMLAIQSGLTAEAAVKKVLEELRVRMEKISNPHIRQRIEDLEDISTRLLYHLSGVDPSSAHSELPDSFVLIARALGPAELLEYGHCRIKGLVLEKGSSASHIAIIAKMMDIPVVAGISGATDIISKGDTVIVDGDHGEVFVRPTDDIDQEINEHLMLRAKQSAAYEAMRDLPPETRDGVRVSLNLNIGIHLDGQQVSANDVDGIGLFRTELPYLTSPIFPDVDSQKRVYKEIYDKAGGKPIIFRTFDVGGDKEVPYIQMPHEENPAMGWRATRIAIDRPLLLKRQFRALLEAAEKKPLRIMFPMIATVGEFDAVKALFDTEMEVLAKQGMPLPQEVRLGVMLEIPSLIFELDAILKRVDFISIGSNDLMQFMFAADRGNEQVASRYDPVRPSILRLLRQITAQCDAAGVELSFCGDMATRPLEAMALLVCGVRHLSLPPASIGPVKAMIRSLDLEQATKYIDSLCETMDRSIRQNLKEFAQDHQVAV